MNEIAQIRIRRMVTERQCSDSYLFSTSNERSPQVSRGIFKTVYPEVGRDYHPRKINHFKTPPLRIFGNLEFCQKSLKIVENLNFANWKKVVTNFVGPPCLNQER